MADLQAPAAAATKRQRTSSAEGSLLDASSSEDGFQLAETRTKRLRTSLDTPEPLTIYTFHRVICNGSSSRGKHHHGHISPAVYLDAPRLYRGDSKASLLRGQQIIYDETQFLVNVAIVIHRIYSCTQYMDDLDGHFTPLPIAGLQQDFVHANRAHFYQLNADGPNPVASSIQIAIQDRDVVDEIGSVLLEADEHLSEWNAPSSLSFPFDFYFHNKLQFREAADSSQIPHLSIWTHSLLSCIDDLAGSDHATARELFAQSYVNSHHFRKLFRIGDIVVPGSGQNRVGHVVEGIEYTPEGVSLRVWTYNYEGTFKKRYTNLAVRHPPVTTRMEWIKLSDLDAFPLRLDQTGLRDSLLNRGRNFWSCRDRRYVAYTAPRCAHQSQTALHPPEEEEKPDNDESLPPPSVKDVSPDDPTEHEDYLLLLPAHVRAFSFPDKKWELLLIDHIEDVNWNTKAFERLVLDPKKKRLLKALIDVHQTTSKGVDIIEGKGNGLIILLHGGPGTGKTLTAESVAELAKKPLYRVTCGDMGVNPEGVEKYLESVLHISTVWDCVVLLDEADIFLERRTTEDIKRNALVSVFLRVLEYYGGILILTTNRIGLFDEAFKSRIQLAVHYPTLDVAGRRKVWRDALNSMPSVVGELEIDLPDLLDHHDELASKPLNGRQIRSTVHSAMQLATHDKAKLQIEHFNDVIDITTEFDNYVAETLGDTDEQIARADGTRR